MVSTSCTRSNVATSKQQKKMIPKIRKNCPLKPFDVVPLRMLKENMSRVMRKPMFCICEKKDADQLRGNREADQRLCFRYLDSTIPLLPKYKISRL